MIVRKIGQSWLFVFPASQGKLFVPDNPAGKISIGDTITLRYALKIEGGKARFVVVDASPLSKEVADNLRIVLKPEPSKTVFGFLVVDTRQSNLEFSIKPANQENVSRHGNLSVMLIAAKGGYKIGKLILD